MAIYKLYTAGFEKEIPFFSIYYLYKKITFREAMNKRRSNNSDLKKIKVNTSDKI